MVKTRITSRGIFDEPGSGVSIETDGLDGTGGLAPYSMHTSGAASITLTAQDAGIITLDGTARTVVLPSLTASVGGMFVLRSVAASAHVITSSQESGNPINMMIWNPDTALPGAKGFVTASAGSRITFPAVAGAYVAMLSTGAHWAVLSSSGTFVIANVGV